MAELASGAVSSLLGVIRNEAQLLRGVKGDVQFIKEEMESMNSFLMHLARTVPPSGEHDEQVRTWMSQVRHLALDCNNCIDLYLYRGNPEIHLSKGGLWRYLMWTPWFLRKTIAQHDAANKLRKLKERARDVGERRVRYGVEVPAKSPSGATAGHDGGDQLVAAAVTDRSGHPRYFEPPSWEDHLERKLLEWMEDTRWVPQYPRSIAIMAPEIHQDDKACTVACHALDKQKIHPVLVDIPAVHLDCNPLRPKEILYYILRELKLENARSQSQANQQEATSSCQDKGQGEQHQPTSQYREKLDIHSEQRELFHKIDDTIQEMQVYRKLQDVEKETLQVEDAQLQPYQGEVKDSSLKHKILEEPLGVLLLLLRLAAAEQDQVGKKKPKRSLATLYEDIIQETTWKLQERMVAGAKQPPPISLWFAQYEDILREIFPKTSNGDVQEQDKKITTTTEQEDHIKEIADKVKQEILREVFPILMTGNSKALQSQDQEQESAAAKQATITIIGEDPISHVDVDKQETIQGAKEDMINEIKEKIDNIKRRIKAQMKIKGIVDKIEKYFKGNMMIIIKIDETIHGYPWEETRKALSLLPHMAGALIITTTRSTHQAEEYCCPEWEPIECSLVGTYRATVLKLTSMKMRQDHYNPQIYRNILENCGPHEFCMKMFVHALSSNPTRSSEELHNLCSILQTVSPKSLSSIAQKMISFSYNDLPKEHKS